MRKAVAFLLLILGTCGLASAADHEYTIPMDIFASPFSTEGNLAKVGVQKFDGVLVDYTVTEGKLSGALGMYLEAERHRAGNSAYALIHVTIIPFLDNGALKFRQKTEISDFRTKVGEWIEVINDVITFSTLGEDVHLDHLVEDIARETTVDKIGKANKELNDFAKQLKIGSNIESLKVTKEGLKVRLGKPENGLAEVGFTMSDAVSQSWLEPVYPSGKAIAAPILEWCPPGFKKDNAVLVVTLFFDSLQLHTIAAIHNGDPAQFGDDNLTRWYRDDVGNPGQNRIVLYLPDKFEIADMSDDKHSFAENRADGWHKWNDKIGSLIIRPGPRFDGNLLRLANDPDFKGATKDFAPGYYSLRVIDKGSMFVKPSAMRVLP